MRAADGTDHLAPIPDAHATVGASGATYGFAIELDRGSVEEKRIRQKIHSYGAWLGSGDYGRRFPDVALRVLFVLEAAQRSPARLERLVRWCEDERAASLFWFTEHERLVESDILRDRIWKVAGSDGLHTLILGDNARAATISSRPLPVIR